MSNVVRPFVGGPGNDVLFGNTVRASVAMIAYNCCCKVINSLGQSLVDVNALETVGGVKTIPTFNAPVVILTEAITELNLALGVPNLTGVGNDCPIVCLTVINNSGSGQVFDSNPALSNVKRTDIVSVMEVDCLYTFYYDPSKESWFAACGLGGL